MTMSQRAGATGRTGKAVAALRTAASAGNDGQQTQSRAAHALLREQIITLVHPPGATLSENRLGQMLDIGPGPARYAIQRLAAERLLNVVPRGQSVVAPIILSEVAQSFQIRTSLEALAARIVAKTLPGDHLAGMREANEAMRTALAQDDLRHAVDHQRRFFRLLVGGANNAKLTETLEPVNASTERFAYFIAAQFHRSMIALDDCSALVEAIAAGDPDRAEKVISERFGAERGGTMMDLLHYDLF